MFERFTKQAKEIVIDSVRHAQRARAAGVGVEHLATALLLARDTSVAELLAAAGLAADQVADELFDAYRAAERRGGLSQTDAAALRKVGLDLDAFVASVEGTFGENVLADEPRRRRRFRTGHLPFAPAAKAVLEGALREARELGDRAIADVHVLLAVLVAGGVPAEVLGAHGVGYPEVRTLLKRAS